MPDPSLDTQYDVLYILRPELSQEEQEAAIAAFEEVVVANGGEVLATSPWGLRRLSYELDGLREGIYVNMPIRGKACVEELDRRLRIDSRTVRHLIIRETRRQYKTRLRQGSEPLVVPAAEEPEPVVEEGPEALVAEEPESTFEPTPAEAEEAPESAESQAEAADAADDSDTPTE